MLQAGVSHEFIEISLGILGVLLGLIQGLTIFILKDIRSRLIRLEDHVWGIKEP